jgi:glycosyltransferase involved in cell wall biosynthesis
MNETFYPISFVTTAMGRLEHVRQTLRQNIAENEDYPAAEFVLLDYGSRDGLEDWVRSDAMSLISAGKLVYFRLDGVEHYSHSHSRNVGFLAASGAVVCNVDADNIMPRGFAFHVNELLHRHPQALAFFAAGGETGGRLATFRNDFLAVGGYDEAFAGWGHEDVDLRNRLQQLGCEHLHLDKKFAVAISHGDAQRIENFPADERRRNATNNSNRRLSEKNLAEGRIVANAGKAWGAAKLMRNFAGTIETGVNLKEAGKVGNHQIREELASRGVGNGDRRA